MKTNNKLNPVYLLFFLSLIAGSLLGLRIFLIKSSNKKSEILIKGQKLLVEIADTPEKRNQGLSGREVLGDNQGMLFIFDKPGNYPFWMKKMKFGLDFVFINGDRVVDIIESVAYPAAGEEPSAVISRQDFDRVLEINQGLVKKLDLKPGAQVQFFE